MYGKLGSVTSPMKHTRQQLIESGHFGRLRGFNEQFISGIAEREAKGVLANPQYGYGECLRSHLSNAGIAILLGEGDDETRRNFQATVEYALKLIGAPPTPDGGMRIHEATVELSERGSELTALHQKRPQAGEEKLSITHYHRALICVTCFGDREQWARVASVPEEAYRNPGVLASEDHWAHVRAWKALLLGDAAVARREAEAAASKGRGAAKAEAAAMIALLDGEADEFKRRLREAVRLFSRGAEKQPNDPIGVAFLPGLMLCRVGLDRGFALEDEAYLPVHLLPNYGSPAK